MYWKRGGRRYLKRGVGTSMSQCFRCYAASLWKNFKRFRNFASEICDEDFLKNLFLKTFFESVLKKFWKLLCNLL